MYHIRPLTITLGDVILILLLIIFGLMVKASGWQLFDRQFEPYPRAIKVALFWCSLGWRYPSDGRIHQLRIFFGLEKL
jgi:hypothetical protein